MNFRTIRTTDSCRAKVQKREDNLKLFVASILKDLDTGNNVPDFSYLEEERELSFPKILLE